MNLNSYNEKALNDTYKNAHLALQSISDLLPQVKTGKLKNELQTQYDGYNDCINEISTFMEQNGITPKDVNPVKKAFMWGSIKLKSMVNSSENQIADMMIKGTVMGINELVAMKNEKKNLDDDVYLMVEKLLKLEEGFETKLKKYL